MRERVEGLIPGMTRVSYAVVRVRALVIFLLPIAASSLIFGACQRASPSPEPLTPAAEVVSTDRPAATDEPSTTPAPSPSATVTPSPLPSETPEPEPTPDGPATVMAIAAPTRQSTIVSPDGRWRAEVDVYPCSELPGGADVLSFEQLNLVDVDNGEATTAAEQLISCGGLGAFGLEGLFWSANSRFFYFTNAREGVPGGCGYWQRPLLRAAVETGETEWLGPGESSPDGAKVAAWQERQLVIWEADGEEVGRAAAAVADADLGAVAWSPDGDALVYLQVSSYCPLEKSYVVHLTIPEMETDVLLEAEAPAFRGADWLDAGRLRLVDQEGEEWIYDLANGVLSPAR